MATAAEISPLPEPAHKPYRGLVNTTGMFCMWSYKDQRRTNIKVPDFVCSYCEIFAFYFFIWSYFSCLHIIIFLKINLLLWAMSVLSSNAHLLVCVTLRTQWWLKRKLVQQATCTKIKEMMHTFPSTCIPVICMFVVMPNPNLFLSCTAILASISSAERKFIPISRTWHVNVSCFTVYKMSIWERTYDIHITHQVVIIGWLVNYPNICKHRWVPTQVKALDYCFPLPNEM